jgi:clan AA aspartic protease
MITGSVNVFRQAVVSLAVRSAKGREQAVEAMVDTGFNGHLTLPSDLIATLGLPFWRTAQAVLGDGSTVTFNIHEAVILWGGRLRRIPVDAADTSPLLGMGLLYGHELTIQAVAGGSVSIRTLPLS